MRMSSKRRHPFDLKFNSSLNSLGPAYDSDFRFLMLQTLLIYIPALKNSSVDQNTEIGLQWLR